MASLDTVLLREITVAALLIFLITRYFIRFPIRKSSRPLPPGPKGFPIIGALPLLGAMPHVTLAKMAKKYGPVMYLKMGTCDMVVASTPDAARAFLKTLDLNFSNRPPNAGATHLAYDAQDMVFADYGPRWKLLRKISNLHMLGGKALYDWSNVRNIELGHMLRAICESSQRNEPVVVPEMLTFAMANMIGQVILSRRVFVTKGTESNEFKDMVVELMTSAGFFNIGDFIPSIAWLDLQGIERGMKKLHNRFDVLLTKMIEEHMASTYERKRKPDFLDIVMANRENSDGERLTITNIKALLLVICVFKTLPFFLSHFCIYYYAHAFKVIKVALTKYLFHTSCLLVFLCVVHFCTYVKCSIILINILFSRVGLVKYVI